jgi:hypothetical protein
MGRRFTQRGEAANFDHDRDGDKRSGLRHAQPQDTGWITFWTISPFIQFDLLNRGKGQTFNRVGVAETAPLISATIVREEEVP